MTGAGRLRRGGMTIIEAMIFGAIASVVIVGIIGLLSRGSKILELSRRTSGAQVDLRVLMETLSEDVAETVMLDRSAIDSDSTAGKPLVLVIRSSRLESGLPAPAGTSTGLRRVEYTLSGSGTLKDAVRVVANADERGAATGSKSERRLVRAGIASLKTFGIAAVPDGSGKYSFQHATANAAGNRGSTVACLLVDVSAGEESGEKTDMEKQTVTSIVTKLWCRNRILEMGRGVIQ
jgi:Tfp pilus assembly protein PilW